MVEFRSAIQNPLPAPTIRHELAVPSNVTLILAAAMWYHAVGVESGNCPNG